MIVNESRKSFTYYYKLLYWCFTNYFFCFCSCISSSLKNLFSSFNLWRTNSYQHLFFISRNTRLVWWLLVYFRKKCIYTMKHSSIDPINWMSCFMYSIILFEKEEKMIVSFPVTSDFEHFADNHYFIWSLLFFLFWILPYLFLFIPNNKDKDMSLPILWIYLGITCIISGRYSLMRHARVTTIFCLTPVILVLIKIFLVRNKQKKKQKNSH